MNEYWIPGKELGKTTISNIDWSSYFYEPTKIPKYNESIINNESDKEEKEIKNLIKNYLIEYYGEKCSEYSEGCENCRKWRAFEVLFDIEKKFPKSNLDYFINKKWPKNTGETLTPAGGMYFWSTKVLPNGFKIGPWKVHKNEEAKTPYQVLCILEQQGDKYMKHLEKIKQEFEGFPN